MKQQAKIHLGPRRPSVQMEAVKGLERQSLKAGPNHKKTHIHIPTLNPQTPKPCNPKKPHGSWGTELPSRPWHT